jgi:DNA-binding transcriptional MerR regulator
VLTDTLAYAILAGSCCRRPTINAIQLQINEVARRAQVSIRTVRYYEEKGIVAPSAHTSGGIRLYSERDVYRLIFVRRLVALGLSLDEIRLRLGTLRQGADRKVRAEDTLALLQMQRERLAEGQAKLDRLTSDIDDSVDKVSRCLDCRAGECPDGCSSYGQLL